ncbi:hypothetical protein DIPPA_16752 [Diplonema papillatum]|nr:hypothetical protein DIPPA_16752 [Diplonema papillatum]
MTDEVSICRTLWSYPSAGTTLPRSLRKLYRCESDFCCGPSRKRPSAVISLLGFSGSTRG